MEVSKVVFVTRWFLFKGGLSNRFDCNCMNEANTNSFPKFAQEVMESS